ncbi:hypothetical protein K490DRAFT_71990 [Saccharata proteae CBS 121410]|uniref:Autophagy-related protein 29 n=1 Tax=Saccharata proteae CBS 121410 TaxID=1314787 RepID=A0A9P4I1B7_9PEZI|nr:hypothetical protein K490DRAFT_71990 [Saccharata proteae CBS 121410]
MTPPPSQPSHGRTASTASAAATHYTVLVRVPFARGDFVDPPQNEWDGTRDQALWKIISRSSRTSELDWHELAERFNVSPAFILQQAAWLYERHLEHVRAQMRKVGSVRDAGTPVPSGSGSGSGNRIGSGGGTSRAASALSTRSRDSPIPSKDGGSAVPQSRGTLSRTPSTTTVTQSRLMNLPTSPRQPSNPTLRSSFRSSFPNAAQRKDSPSTNPTAARQASPSHSPRTDHSSSSAGSSSDENEGANPLRRSQLFKRPPRFTKNTKHAPMPRLSDSDGGGEAESSDDEGFLPFAQRQPTQPQATQDPSATLRSASGSDRAPPGNARPLSATQTAAGGPGALSPRHRAELARLGSPRARGREGSEGTPSMGSSFSDLDDASVTQSALEEQLLSHMQHGGMSKMSSISQALRSKYL